MSVSGMSASGMSVSGMSQASYNSGASDDDTQTVSQGQSFRTSSSEADSFAVTDSRITKLSEYQQIVHYMLVSGAAWNLEITHKNPFLCCSPTNHPVCVQVFDIWHDLLASPNGTRLSDMLIHSIDSGERRLGEQLIGCAASLPRIRTSGCDSSSHQFRTSI